MSSGSRFRLAGAVLVTWSLATSAGAHGDHKPAPALPPGAVKVKLADTTLLDQDGRPVRIQSDVFGHHGVLRTDDPLVVLAPPLLWVEALDRLIGELTANHPREMSRLAAIAGSAQQHGSVYLTADGIARIGALDPTQALADQLAGDPVGAFPDLAPRQARQGLAARRIKGDPGLPLGGVVQHLRHRPEVGAAQGKLGIAGGKQVHTSFSGGEAGSYQSPPPHSNGEVAR